jgi:hypothetical protein
MRDPLGDTSRGTLKDTYRPNPRRQQRTTAYRLSGVGTQRAAGNILSEIRAPKNLVPPGGQEADGYLQD